MSKLLINEPPLQILPTLAVEIGLHEAIVIQQLHYWLIRTPPREDGRRWVYNTYKQWKEQFPFWSVRTIQTVFLKLEKDGLIDATDTHNRDFRDRTKWYTINYEHTKLCGEDAKVAHSKRTQDLRAQDAKVAHSSIDRDYNTENTTETTVVGADAPPPAPKKRATRIPEPFGITEQMILWANDQGIGPHVMWPETEKFIDYWVAQPGQKGVKLDWEATWRNWMRRSLGDSPGNVTRIGGAANGRASPEESIATRQLRESRERREREGRIA